MHHVDGAARVASDDARRAARRRARISLWGALAWGIVSIAALAVDGDRAVAIQPPDPNPPPGALAPPAAAAPVDLPLAPVDASPVAELEQLLQSAVEVPAMEQEVTTVSGQQSTVGRSPAAVFVITQEMIRRSGATSIPEALRMAPGLQVARVNSHDWVITARGFAPNDGFFTSSRMLLVLIDGRSIYTTFSGGVYWDVQDLILDDIDRIEVIRGPGATIWGANAVNGVINIITKSSADTQGGLVRAGGGTEELGFTSARIGGQAGENVTYRIYGKWFDRNHFDKPLAIPPVGPAVDDWNQGRGGFRVDWNPCEHDLFTVQGDFYEGEEGFYSLLLAGQDFEEVRGGNLLARWTRTYDDDSDVSVQVYYDRAERENTFLGFLDQEIGTFDVQLRRHLELGERHNVVWGLGYRDVSDTLESRVPFFLALDPVERDYDTFSGFVQDEITLVDEELFLTLGAKLSDNDFTDFEIQPTIRLLYSPDESWAAWAAISRPVRTPARLEHDGRILINGFLYSRDFEAEEMLAYEVGFRQQPEPWFSWDVTAFYQKYNNLISGEFLVPPVAPFVFTNGNDIDGEAYGVDIFAQWDVTPCWRVSGWYSYLQLQIHPGPSTIDAAIFNGEDIEGSSPLNQASLMSSHDLTDDLELDLIGRYVDNLPFLAPGGRPNVPHYISLDARLAWQWNPQWELTAVGQNLLDSHHREFGQSFSSTEVPRGVYLSITRTW